MQEIYGFDKNSPQETWKMLFRGFGNAMFCGGACPQNSLVRADAIFFSVDSRTPH